MAKSTKPQAWHDRYWNSAEGLRLHYRDYPGPADRPPVLCIPGLTRNARDFETLAARLAGEWRVIVVDLRGRGLSQHDPMPLRYALPVYVADIMKLMDQLGIAEAVFVGTSLGGLVTMAIAAGGDEERIAGALLNDIGPDIEREGLDFIARYVGKDTRFADWDEAVAELKAVNQPRYPDFTDAQWDEYARRVCADDEGGKVRMDYDPRIADNFHTSLDAEPVDAWPYFAALQGRPITIVRGTLSDLFTAATAARMAAAHGDAEIVEVPRRGHAPTLDEAESIGALDRLLQRVSARG